MATSDACEADAQNLLGQLAADVRARVVAMGVTEVQIIEELRTIRKRRHQAEQDKVKLKIPES